ncbi:dihydrodipicolinate synthase family protein [Aureimonas fodinaquatilis]|uniref:Dihydrodipicolinate synthase family protein n=1 Tax=Aureimonas fodinaquatilis TaxID=2565783 RepID=A0A5B0DUN7_9HYPH|nr:dihydrodipicolinate synthase family protein [Aureimonas fodinaquatilis]KAA0970176.1 dihydrodipicolinate synthase family protein [Aureimonas fodinaquatilis]
MSDALRAGIIPAPVMPFNTDASVDWETFDRYMVEMADGGASAIAVNMAAAEVTTLELEEQVEAVRRATKAVAGACPIVAGIVSGSTNGAIRIAREVEDAGAEGIVVFPPLPTFSSRPVDVAMVVDHHAAIAQAVKMPVIAFNTGNATYPAGTIKALSDIPSLVAIKDAVFNIEITAEMVDEAEETGNRVVVMTGNDTFVLESLMLGCPGALIGYAGTATAELVKMQRHVAAGEITEAHEVWTRLGPLARFVWSAPLRDYRPRMKYVLARQGVLPNTVTRAPQPGIRDADKAVIDALFEKHGYADALYRPRGRA